MECWNNGVMVFTGEQSEHGDLPGIEMTGFGGILILIDSNRLPM